MSEEIPGSDAVAANRRLWDAWTRIHRDSSFYDVAGFLAGRDPLNRIETEELGDVSGKRFLHLQCHFGVDTLGWARRGAVVKWLGEHARTPYPFPEFLEERPDGEYGWPDGRDDVPLLLSLGASHA